MEAGNRSQQSLSEINVTPLVDVMLVLLIIFMVATPMIHQKTKLSQQKTRIDVPYPEAVTSKDAQQADPKFTLEVHQNRTIYFAQDKHNKIADCETVLEGDYKACLEPLKKMLEASQELQEKKEVYISADWELDYEFVIAVMSTLKIAGIDKLGLVTDPPRYTKQNSTGR